jgi:nucleoside-diphosphate-sugar epimerase
MTRVLVTGGAGYLGSILTETLLDAGYSVRVLDSLMYGQGALFHLCANPEFEFIRGDARSEPTMKKALADVQVVIPLAALVGAPACDLDPWHAKSVNLEAIRLLLKLRDPAQLIVYPTTNSGYGTKSGATFCTEETPLEPVSLYGQTKVDAERDVLAEPNTITLRLATVFGTSPRPRIDLLVNHFVYAALRDRYLVLFEGDFKRNYIHIRDVADVFTHCIKNAGVMKGRQYNAGLEDANLSKMELAQKIKQHVPGFVITASELASDPDKRNYIVSNQRLADAGFIAKRSLDDGIRELIKGYPLLGRFSLGNV